MAEKEAAPPAKKASTESSIALADFELVEILRQDLSHQFAALHLRHRAEATNGVLLISALPLAEDVLREKLLSDGIGVEVEMRNDAYANLRLLIPANLSPHKATLIHPATQKHLDKYREQELEMVTETPAAFDAVTLPHLEAGNAFSLRWVQNFLEGKAEAERVVYDDKDPRLGFVIAPDLKWDGKDPQMLYLTAVVRDAGLRSLRDLRAEHLPLLEAMAAAAEKVAETRYGVSGRQIRLFFHYPPSFYHLHLHIVRLGADYPGMLVGKAHLLQDVCALLRLRSEIFTELPLTFALAKNDPLLAKLRAYHQ